MWIYRCMIVRWCWYALVLFWLWPDFHFTCITHYSSHVWTWLGDWCNDEPSEVETLLWRSLISTRCLSGLEESPIRLFVLWSFVTSCSRRSLLNFCCLLRKSSSSESMNLEPARSLQSPVFLKLESRSSCSGGFSRTLREAFRKNKFISWERKLLPHFWCRSVAERHHPRISWIVKISWTGERLSWIVDRLGECRNGSKEWVGTGNSIRRCERCGKWENRCSWRSGGQRNRWWHR